MSLMDLLCERFKSAISKAGAETNLVFIISQPVWCSFVEVKSSRYVLLKPLFRILIGQNPAFPRSPSALCLGCCQAGSCLFSVRQRMKLRYMTCYLHTCAFFWEPFHPQSAEFRVPMVFCRRFACCDQVIDKHWSKSPSQHFPKQGRGNPQSLRQHCPAVLLDSLRFWVLPPESRQLQWFFCSRNAGESVLQAQN